MEMGRVVRQVYNRNQIIHIDPMDIDFFSVVWETEDKRKALIDEFGHKYEHPRLWGDWDLKSPSVMDRDEWARYELFKAGKEKEYRVGADIDGTPFKWNWENLYNSIKQGYSQPDNDRCVEVAIGRNGKYYITDGLHRVIIARDLGIKTIPVEVVYVHGDYKFDNLHTIQDEVIPEIIYDLIVEEWDKDVVVYQDYPWVSTRHNTVSNFFKAFQGKDVLDIGCNGFMSAWSVMKYAKSMIGIESNEGFYRQGKKTLECLTSYWQGKDVEIYNKYFRDYITNPHAPFDAFLGYCILYWLEEDDVKLLCDEVLPKCNNIIVSSRMAHNPSHRNKRELWKEKNLKAFVTEQGFAIDAIGSNNNVLCILGRKK